MLVADDDRDLRELIGFTLTQAGYLVVKAGDGPAALRMFEAESPDLVVLDINMPGASGFQVCEAIRKRSRVPVIMLTVRGEEEDLVRALELGATTISPSRSALAPSWRESRRCYGGREWRIPRPSRWAVSRWISTSIRYESVRYPAEPVRLTKLELRLLQMLLANAGHTVSTDRLLIQVWGHRNSADRQLLKQLVHRLRQKIEVDPATPQPTADRLRGRVQTRGGVAASRRPASRYGGPEPQRQLTAPAATPTHGAGRNACPRRPRDHGPQPGPGDICAIQL